MQVIEVIKFKYKYFNSLHLSINNNSLNVKLFFFFFFFFLGWLYCQKIKIGNWSHNYWQTKKYNTMIILSAVNISSLFLQFNDIS